MRVIFDVSLEIRFFYTKILKMCIAIVPCGVFHKWKNPQFDFSSQNLSLECSFFKKDGKVLNQDMTPTFP